MFILVVLILIGAFIYYFGFSESGKKMQEENLKRNEEIKQGFEGKIKTKFEEENIIPTLQFMTENKSVLAIDENTQQVCILTNEYIGGKKHIYYANYTAETYAYKDILESEIIIDGETVSKTSRSSQIGGALIGAALTGGVGAIIGGLSGKKSSIERVEKIHLKLLINNMKNPIKIIPFLDTSPSIDKKNKKFISAKNQVDNMHGLFKLIIDMVDKAERNQGSHIPIEKKEVLIETQGKFIELPERIKEVKVIQNEEVVEKVNSFMNLQKKGEESVAVVEKKGMVETEKKFVELPEHIKVEKVIPKKEVVEEVKSFENLQEKGEEPIAVVEKKGWNKKNPSFKFSVADEIRKLHDLQNEGIITPEEFDNQKAKIIG